MDNLELYNRGRAVPQEAIKTIAAGRLKGKSDINPMWRIKKLTEMFGPVGIGWYTTTTKEELHTGANGEVMAQVDIELRYKVNGEWSMPVFGTGGAMFVENETKGLHTSDEAFKMAYTDAISVACKAIGIAADVYFSQDRTKYSHPKEPENHNTHVNEYICIKCGKVIAPYTKLDGTVASAAEVSRGCGGMCYECYKKS